MSTHAINVEQLASIDELHARLDTRAQTPGTLIQGRLGDGGETETAIILAAGRGFVPTEEVAALSKDTDYLFFVEDCENDRVQLSFHKAQRLGSWDWFTQLQKSGDSVQVTVLGHNRGGLVVDLMGVKATLGMLELEASLRADPDALVGQKLDVQVTSIREKKAQIQVSQRALTEGNRAERKAFTLANLEEGQVLDGEVRRLTNFGAFVDIGGVDGLLHVKDMRWKRVDHPRDVVNVGDVVQVKVLRFDLDSEKISLGTKQLLPDPWADAESRYRPQVEVSGHVVGLTEFGAFVMLDDGIEGLVHVSEMAWDQKVEKAADFLKKGQPVKAWVVRCDIERRRLGLTIKDPANNPWLKLKERLPIGDKLATRVTSVVDFGLFVELGEGLEGLVHVSDFTWGPSDSTPAELYSVGQEIDVMLLDVDVERGRANLGIKQLSDPADGGKFEVDAIVVGRVTNVQSYGVFVDLGYGKEGMIHVDTLGDDAAEALAQFQDGQSVSVKVMAIDEEDDRFSLSFVGTVEHAEVAADDAVSETPISDRIDETEEAVAVNEDAHDDAPATSQDVDKVPSAADDVVLEASPDATESSVEAGDEHAVIQDEVVASSDGTDSVQDEVEASADNTVAEAEAESPDTVTDSEKQPG